MDKYFLNITVLIFSLLIPIKVVANNQHTEAPAPNWVEKTGATPRAIPDLGSRPFNLILENLKMTADAYEKNGWYLSGMSDSVPCDLSRKTLLNLNGVESMFENESELEEQSLLDSIYADSNKQSHEESGISEIVWEVKDQKALSNNCDIIEYGVKAQNKGVVTYVAGLYESTLKVPLNNFEIPLNKDNILPTDQIGEEYLIRKGLYLSSWLKFGEISIDGTPTTLDSFIAYSTYYREPYELDNILSKQLVITTGKLNDTYMQMTYSGQHDGIYHIRVLKENSDGSTSIKGYHGEKLTSESKVNAQGKLHGIAKLRFANEPHSTKCYDNGQEVILSKCL